MKNGKCPRCGASNVYSGSHLPLKGGPFNSNCIPVSLTSMAPLDNYVCASCGLVESYIADKKRLKEIESKWEQVNGSSENESEEKSL